MLAICVLLKLLIGNCESSIVSEFALNEIDANGKMLINAGRKILQTFYMHETSTVFITISSEMNERNEIFGEIIKTDQLLITYVTEESEYVNDELHKRFYNLFIVDTYESFQ